MNGAEDNHIREPDDEPRWLHSLRNVRTAFDLVYPPFLCIAAAVAVAVILRHPELQTPQIVGLLSAVLITAAGLGIRKR